MLKCNALFSGGWNLGEGKGEGALGHWKGVKVEGGGEGKVEFELGTC